MDLKRLMVLDLYAAWHRVAETMGEIAAVLAGHMSAVSLWQRELCMVCCSISRFPKLQ